jgi:hypothetical protein
MQSADDRTEDIKSHVGSEEIDKEKDVISPLAAITAIDSAWYSRLNPRWMDLIGEYAGTEMFVVEGEIYRCAAYQNWSNEITYECSQVIPSVKWCSMTPYLP